MGVKEGRAQAAQYLREVAPGQSVDRAQFLLRMAREIEELP